MQEQKWTEIVIGRPGIARTDLGETTSNVPIGSIWIGAVGDSRIAVTHAWTRAPTRPRRLAVEVERHPSQRRGVGPPGVEILERHDAIAKAGGKNLVEFKPVTEQ